MRNKAFFLASIILLCGFGDIGRAQVTTNITSSGLGTAVSPISSGVVTITGGTRAGTNLFHSFGLFNVGAGDTANFFNNTSLSTTNILSRVTGGNPSNIFGTIQTTGFGNANFFLINPAGVVFGPNASLSIGGSFHVSTADYMRLEEIGGGNAGIFYADPAHTSVLTSAPVTAFGFLDPNPAAIAIQGSTLQVPDGQILSVVAGEVTIQGGTLSAPNGRVQVAGVGPLAVGATEGEVIIRSSGGAPDFQLSGDFAGTGQVQLVNDPAPVFEGTLFTAGSLTNLDGTYHITLLEIGDTGKLEAVIPLAVAGLEYTIPGDKGKFGGDLGANWFLTFSRFDLIGGETATFQSPGVTINNILSRVIGGQPSVIDGTLNWFPDATLYFLNPAGVSFLANAQLGTDVTGSFHVSTADYLRLGTAGAAGSGIFYADATKLSDSALTSASPTAFGFTSSAPAPITFENTLLSVPAGQTLSVVGGDITVTGGTLSAPGGQINLASVASKGEILLQNMQTAPNVNGDSFSTTGTINLSQAAALDVSGDPGGTVFIRGGQFVMDGAAITNINTGNTAAGDITINAETVSLTNGAQIISSTEGTGDGGRILVTATDLVSISGFDGTGTLSGEAPFFSVISGVFTKTSSSASGGAVIVDAPSVTLDNGGTIATVASGNGPGGNIEIKNAGTVNLASGGQIISFSGQDITRFDTTTGEFSGGDVTGLGRGGDITVKASDSVLISGGSLDVFTLSSISSQTSSGTGSTPAGQAWQGGNVVISSPRLTLENAGAISTATSGAGTGGAITIQASNQLSVSGFSDDFGMPSAIASSASSSGSGGAVNISASSVTVADRGIIQATNSFGRGGDIALDVGSLSVTGGGFIEALGGNVGSTGHIGIMASGTVSISGQFDADNLSHVSNANNATGGSGGISINAKKFILSDGAQIVSLVDTPEGATVAISATESVALSNAGQIVLAGGSLGSGALNLSAPLITLDQAVIRGRTNTDRDAGAVTLSGSNLTLSSGSHILTSTQQGSGNAGPIVLAATDSIAISGGSTVESSSLNVATGSGGTITATAGNLVSIGGAGSGLFSIAQSAGNGGKIVVSGSQVVLSDGAAISAQSTGTGNAGNIKITASDSLVMQGHSSITTQTVLSDGGNINIQVGRLVQLTDSQITTSVQGGLGNGGNITIDPQFVIVQGSQILANAFGGNGGNILIVAGVFLVDPTSTISASSTFGVSGTVNVQTTVTNLSESVAPLSGEFVHTPELLQARCAARFQGGQYSSFVVAGHDGLPLEPGGLLPSPLFVERQGSPKLGKALDVPGLRVGRALEEASLVLAPLELGCAS